MEVGGGGRRVGRGGGGATILLELTQGRGALVERGLLEAGGAKAV